MDNLNATTDWSLIQSFLAVAEAGSLSAAARRLNRSQPTLGRQIRQLEDTLGTLLFERHPRGLRLSASGQELLPMAQEMHSQMNAISLAVAGRAQALEGTVRIAASNFASHHLLPPILADIRRAEPAIELELVPSDATENLLFRAADIAVRMYRPTQLDIVTRHVRDLEISVFAATSYLDRAGRPENVEDLLSHDLVGYDSDDLILRSFRELGWPIDRHHFRTRCDSHTAYWELVRAGCGIGFSQANVGRADPAVEELHFDIEIPSLTCWLAAHPTLRSTPRVARVWELLAEGLIRA